MVRILVAFAILVAVIALTQLAIRALPGPDSAALRLLEAIAVCLLAPTAYSVFVRTVERRPVSELAVSGAFAELAYGVLLGAALFGATIAALWALGYYRASGLNPWVVVIPAFAGALISGVGEELLFRGVLFRISEEGLGTWLALLLSALVFGLLHLMSPNPSLGAALAVTLEAGVLLAAAYTATRRLWLAMGVHFAWNFVQGGIFGAAVSGNPSIGLLQAELAGPDLLSGGAFGPEASVFAVAFCLLASMYLLWRTKQRGQWVKPSWRR